MVAGCRAAANGGADAAGQGGGGFDNWWARDWVGVQHSLRRGPAREESFSVMDQLAFACARNIRPRFWVPSYSMNLSRGSAGVSFSTLGPYFMSTGLAGVALKSLAQILR